MIRVFEQPPAITTSVLSEAEITVKTQMSEKESVEKARDANPLCAQEALDLLNCVADKLYDQEKCARLLNSLRECVVTKKVKKFSLDYEKTPTAGFSTEKP